MNTNNIIIGRKSEIQELKRLYNSRTSEFVAVYGRRRVGKTFLVKELLGKNFTFYTSGLAKGTYRDQLMNFYSCLRQYGLSEDHSCPTNWFEAFGLLKELLAQSSQKRKVVFIDELPWFDTPKSKMVMALDNFWNTWASSRNDIMLIICGSAASWMVKNIIKNRGGLHNRITGMIKLMPFSLGETEEYLLYKGIRWPRQTTAEAYMILGGIPYYLASLDKDMSLAQNVDRLFFCNSSILGEEFDNLYSSLFKQSAEYVAIIRLLARKKSGYSRAEIISGLKIADGGGLTRRLTELEQCGFIRKYKSLGSATNIYQLVDFFTLFYFQFIERNKAEEGAYWMHMQGNHAYSTWQGLAFERLCFAQLGKIKNALGIDGILTKSYPYLGDSMQLDLVIERSDKAVSACEIKWSESAYRVTAKDVQKIGERRLALQQHFPRKTIFTVFIAANGIQSTPQTSNLVNAVVTLNDLF